MTALAGTPKIHGSARIQATLRANPGTWTHGTKFHYRWYADGQAIPRATESTLKVSKSLKGKAATVTVAGKNSGYATVTRTSTPTAGVR